MSIEVMKQALAYLKEDMYAHAEMSLNEAIEQAEQAQPVAWFSRALNDLTFSKPDDGEGIDWVPLYTTPPPRQSLTDEQISRLCLSAVTVKDATADVRAIEAAHGIKG